MSQDPDFSGAWGASDYCGVEVGVAARLSQFQGEEIQVVWLSALGTKTNNGNS